MIIFLNLFQGFDGLEVVEDVVHDTVVQEAAVDEQGGTSVLSPIGQAEQQAAGGDIEHLEQILGHVGHEENPIVGPQVLVQVRHYFLIKLFVYASFS